MAELLCQECGKLERNENGYCEECIEKFKREDEELLQDEEAEPEAPVTEEDEDSEGEGDEGQQTQGSSGEKTPNIIANAKETKERIVAKSKATIERVKWSTKAFLSIFNIWTFWIAIGLIIVFVVANASVTTYQTTGSIRDSGEVNSGGGGMSDDVLERLAQRGTLLAKEANKYGNVDLFVSARGGNAARTNGNIWSQACPDIVNLIYGMPDIYIGNNGIVNAYQNYKRLLAAGLTPQAWWFPETSSPGATKNDPPPGAIVQSTSGSAAGHTYVVLTEDGKVIDNTWTIDNVPVAGPGYRTLNEGWRNGIRGWFVPPAEGYEGTFLNDDPMLPPVPEWAGGSGGGGGSSGGGGTSPKGEPQAIAKEMVKSRGWSEGEFTCLVKLWTRESGWNPKAENKSSGAYGIPQSLPGSKMASAGADWKTNPATQIKWGLDYISGRYTAPCGAWAHSEAKNWY